ncbi:MAG: 6-carboxytetrahydropterin synthase QueD [Candidatus Omnitrophica bacterium]|nr:6-carboxytetrahydropterin synthase QueD [Candidatus Omnitrophota bacterium]
MYSVRIEGDFSSAHNLRGYKGKCEDLHGHNWKVGVVVRKPKTDKTGMVMDFKLLKARLNAILDTLDHKHLNKIAYFKKVNPTSENIAKYLYDRMRARKVDVYSVTVWESDSSSATYYE